jgi:hypothetical protein
MIGFEQLASYTTHADHHDLFRTGELVERWAKTYPMLFDDDDLRIAQNQADMGYHFYEWLAAILIYHDHGLFSLVEKYQFDAHAKKHQKLDRLAEPEVAQFIRSHPDYGNAQCPDLLVYRPDYSDWFFCEVKGPTDRVRSEQAEFFRALTELSGKSIKLVEFKQIPQSYLEA